MVDEAGFRELMTRVCSPVTVITTLTPQGLPYGTTVGAFMSLSLRPPMVAAALDRGSGLLAHAQASGRIGINVLRCDAGRIAAGFARTGADKFDGVDWILDHGLPRLRPVCAWLACEIASIVPGGDHLLLLSQVTSGQMTDNPPLTYLRRSFGTHLPIQQRVSLLSLQMSAHGDAVL
jgi:flavin reductase (DIM6/NTAB) family NADH-FMN oxidoreductase RutF